MLELNLPLMRRVYSTIYRHSVSAQSESNQNQANDTYSTRLHMDSLVYHIESHDLFGPRQSDQCDGHEYKTLCTAQHEL